MALRADREPGKERALASNGVEQSRSRILILGGVMVLLVSCGLIVLFARDML